MEAYEWYKKLFHRFKQADSDKGHIVSHSEFLFSLGSSLKKQTDSLTELFLFEAKCSIGT